MKAHPTRYLLIVVAALWLATAGTASAASTTIEASATIQTATLALTPQADMDFGTITGIASGGATILIDASAGAAVPVVDTGIAAVTIAGQSGLINVLSPVDATVNITYSIAGDVTSTADVIEYDDGGTTRTMDLTATSIASYSTGGGTNPGTLALTANNAGDINVGGVLQVGAAQVAGTYKGTITVVVDYP